MFETEDIHFTPPSPEELNQHFPGHEIIRFIAKGGMGAVYLAKQTSLDRKVCIKILPKEFAQDKNYLASFETEAKSLARLNHGNLVGIYDFGRIDDMLFIIMEYVPGKNLYELASGKAVDQLQAAKIIAEICHGLAHAHEVGTLHRDIKPANILIDSEAQPKVVDFGLAKPLGEKQTSGVIFGTEHYTAPEVVNHPDKVDQRSDIYSVGVMLYELLTGHVPEEPFIAASEDNDTDRRFDSIIYKSAHPDPSKRYKSAKKMAEDLEDILVNWDDKPTDNPLARFNAPITPTTTITPPAPSAQITTPLAGAYPTYRQAKPSNAGNIVMWGIMAAGLAIAGYFFMQSLNAPDEHAQRMKEIANEDPMIFAAPSDAPTATTPEGYDSMSKLDAAGRPSSKNQERKERANEEIRNFMDANGGSSSPK